MLGERIKRLRKQRKMTLEALAGRELSKGMLSLIENNKAKPSMESLAYIAERLEVTVSDLMEEISSDELRVIIDKAEQLYNIPLQDHKQKYQQLRELIEPVADRLSQGYEGARLLELYSYALCHEKDKKWNVVAEQAAVLYEQLKIASNRAALSIFRTHQKFAEHHYEEALEIFLYERAKIENTFVFIDPLTRLDLDYLESVLFFAVGNSDSAIKIMESAITFSKEKSIFYRIDDLYRLAAAQGMMSRDEKKKLYYLEKLKQYGEFADNNSSLHFYELIHIMTLLSETKEYNKALSKLNELLSKPGMQNFYEPWFILEKGKALYYLKRYEEALDCLLGVTIPEMIHHPFDLSIFYSMDTYKALCYHELGQSEEANHAIHLARENFLKMPDTPFKEYMVEVFEKLTGRQI